MGDVVPINKKLTEKDNKPIIYKYCFRCGFSSVWNKDISCNQCSNSKTPSIAKPVFHRK